MHVIRRLYFALVSTDEHWFCVDAADKTADILRIYSSPYPVSRGTNEAQPTIVIDLSRDESLLWQEISKETRYEIRRAERDHVVFRFHRERSADWLNLFANEYEQLRKRKKLEPLRLWRLQELHRRGMIAASTSEDGTGRPLSWHVYVNCRHQARLLHSVSCFGRHDDAEKRAAAGRANRFHHWRDMLAFKAEGNSVYDFGGAYRGSEDPAKAAITNFKKNFGGVESVRYDSVLPLTWRGKLVVLGSQGTRSLESLRRIGLQARSRASRA